MMESAAKLRGILGIAMIRKPHKIHDLYYVMHHLAHSIIQVKKIHVTLKDA